MATTNKYIVFLQNISYPITVVMLTWG